MISWRAKLDKTIHTIISLIFQIKKNTERFQNLSAMKKLWKLYRAHPDICDNILLRLNEGVDENLSEYQKFCIAEEITQKIYPKYKFSEFGRIFLEDEEFINYYEKFMDVNNWHSLDRKYSLNQLLKQVKGLNGDIAECGVYKGASAYLLCQAQNPDYVVHLFDSFEGLSTPGKIDGGYWRPGDLKADLRELKKNLHVFKNYQIFPGWIPDSFENIQNHIYKFIHIDVDLYEPTLESLKYFYERTIAGGIILMDDYGFNSCPGAKMAADFFFENLPEDIILLPTGQAFIIKLHDLIRIPLEIKQSEVPIPIKWDAELVKSLWDGFSHTELVAHSFSRQAGSNLLSAVSHLLSPEKSVLDYGAGDGDLCKHLCSFGIKTSAFEPSLERRRSLLNKLGKAPNFIGIEDFESQNEFDIVFFYRGD